MHVHFRMDRIIRPLLLLAVVFMALQAGAQNKFTINGRLKIDGGDLNGARIVVYRNGEKERVITTGVNKFSMDLELNASYVLSFEKDGFVAKKLSFNTKIPMEAAVKSFTPFDYAVSLFKQYDDLNMVVFNQPVGIIRYEPSMGDFDYDTDYTKSIQAQLQQALAAVEQKQKEEAKNAGADAKKKAAEEKALAKAQADAEKQAAADARAKAEAEKQAAADAKAKAAAEEQAAAALALAEQKAREEAAKEDQRKEEEARMAEAKRKEDEKQAAMKKEEKPKEQPMAAAVPAKPTPQPKPAPTPPPPAPKPRPVQAPVKQEPPPQLVRRPPPPASTTTVTATGNKGSEERRWITPVVAQEERPAVVQEEVFTERFEELIEEKNKLTTVVKVTVGESTTEYRRVFHKWGGTFYFKNGAACSQQVYQQEALGEHLAGATPGRN